MNDDEQTGRKQSARDLRIQPADAGVNSCFRVQEVPLPGPARDVSAGFASLFILGRDGPGAVCERLGAVAVDAGEDRSTAIR